MSVPAFSACVALAATIAPLECARAQPSPAQWLSAPWPVHTVVRDSRRHRMLLFRDRSGCGPEAGEAIWFHPAATASRCAPLHVEGVGPELAYGYRAVYDSLRDRVLVAGGQFQHCIEATGGLWELQLSPTPMWHRIDPPGEIPPERDDPVLLLDSTHDRLVLYGGRTWSTHDSFADVWTLPLGSPSAGWRHMPDSPAGARHQACAALMPAHASALLCGGLRSPSASGSFLPDFLQDTWELEFVDTLRWVRWLDGTEDLLTLPNPPQLMTEGRASSGPIRFEGSTMFVDVPGPAIPPARFDPERHRWLRTQGPTSLPDGAIVVAGAWDPDSQHVFVMESARPDLNALELGSTITWRCLSPVPARTLVDSASPDLVYDPIGDRVLGYFADGLWSFDAGGDHGWNHELAFDWHTMPNVAELALADPERREMLFLGAHRGWTMPRDSVWAVALDGPPGGRWLPYEADSTFFDPAWASAFDARRHREIVVTSPGHSPTGEPALWTMDLGDTLRFHVLPTTGTPPRLGRGALVVDPVRDRLLYLVRSFPTLTEPPGEPELWQLDFADGARWTQLHPAGPLPFFGDGITAFYDASRDRFVFFVDDGTDVIQFPLLLGDRLSWGRPSAASTGLRLASRFGFVRDEARGRVLAHEPFLGLMMALDASDAPRPSLGSPTVIREGRSFEITARSDAHEEFAARLERSTGGGAAWSLRSIVHPDADGTLSARDSVPDVNTRVGYRFRMTIRGASVTLAETWLGSAAPAALRLGAVRPNPASAPITVELGVPADAVVTLSLHDLAGRRVAGPWAQRLAAGTHVLAPPWGAGLRPGLYLVRAHDGRSYASARVVIVR
jgi:hypothetical protein